MHGGTRGPRLLTGIGSARRSRLLADVDVDDCVLVPDALAVAVCRLLSDRLGLRLGGSSGAVIAASVITASKRQATTVACICPDGGDRYSHSIYDAGWRVHHNLDDASADPLIDVSFRGWSGERWTGLEVGAGG